MNNSIRKETEKSPVTVDSIRTGEFQKEGTETAVLRQEVTVVSFYPSAVHASDMQHNPFSQSEFGDEEQEFSSQENRVAFVDVPLGTTVEQVGAKIKENAVLYKTLSNHPILTSNHKSAIDNGVTTLEEIANSQVVRYPEGDEREGQLILDPKGNVQYRKVYFWNEPREDQDLRGHEDHPVFVSQEIADELRADNDGVLQSQEVIPGNEATTDDNQSSMG